MARYTCPKCHFTISPPAGAAGAGDATRLACPRCGSQYTLRRAESPGGASTGGGVGGTGESGDGSAARRGFPARIGPYEIVQVLGRGGMGVVYKARDAALDRWVAVKTLLPSLAGDTEARERFLREARAAAALSHPNLTQIYSIGEESGMPYFAMEFIEGETLAQRLDREQKLKPAEAIRLVRQVAVGLEEAQRVQLVHRDIKPANLILTREGTLKITDFGLAKRAQGAADLSLTATGQAIGSPLYMSPEQARGAAVDHRADIYSLGATFFHLLAGRPPFQAPSAMDVAMKHVQEPAPSPRAFASEVSYPLAGLVQRMLRKRPEDRFAGYRALIHELDRVEALERGATSPSQAVPVWVKERRGSSLASLAGFLALCVAAGLIGFRAVRSVVRDRRLQYRPAAADARGAEAREPAAGAAGGLRSVSGGLRLSGGGEATRTGATSQEEPRLKVHDLANVQIGSGIRVHGRVLHEGGGPAEEVQVEVRTYDSSGSLLYTRPIVPEGGERMVAGQSAHFEAYFESGERIARVEARITWSY